MNDKKFMTGIILATVVIIGAGLVLATQIGKPAAVQINPDAHVTAVDSVYDWGTIGINDGNVEHEFVIANTGKGTLLLSQVVTSCMCTTAQLILGDTVSPEFGMHSQSSYVLDVPEGETATLKVVFDPAFHGPGGVGSITRQVTVATNDPKNPELSFMLSALVE